MKPTMMLLLLTACPFGKDPATDSGTTFTGTSTIFPQDDTNRTDTEPRETGPYVALSYDGEITGDGLHLKQGKYGFAAYHYNLRQNRSDLNRPALCKSYAVLVEGDPIEATCNGCDYSYSLIGTEGGGSDGADCQKLLDAGVSALDQQNIDAYFVGFSFGMAWVPAYQNYGFGAVLSYQFDYPEYGWFLFAYDYDVPYQDPNGSASGGGGTIKWTRPIRDRNSRYELYYAY